MDLEAILFNIDIDRFLTKRQAHVVRMRYFEKSTYQEIGDSIKVTKRHAQRICDKAVAKLIKKGVFSRSSIK
jgi:RNA polymerase sigma factor (sigma-70 family)